MAKWNGPEPEEDSPKEALLSILALIGVALAWYILVFVVPSGW